MRKVQQDLNAGTATVLVVFREVRLAYLYRGQGKAEVFENGPIEILPGFTIDLHEILS